MTFIYTPPEPTDDQLVKGVKAMRLFVTKNSVADFRLGYMAALAADTQLRSEVERVRRETVAECAKLCRSQAATRSNPDYVNAAIDCSVKIRRLK